MKRFWSIFRSILSNAVDTFTKSERSRIMAAVKSKDTSPELAVRRLVHAMGYRYRLHVHSLPGNPDLAFPRLRKVSNVNGCFWHLHGCPRCRILSSRRRCWVAKLGRNAARDKRTRRQLRKRLAGIGRLGVPNHSAARETPSGTNRCLPGHGRQATAKEEVMLEKSRIICGDAETVIGTLPQNSVNLTVTSPPYFQHRDYGVDGQLGGEATVHDYIKNIQGVLAELLRVTAETGTCFFVVGDTYRNQKLLLVPHRIALAADEVGWTVRNDLIWSKLDPPPESPRNRWRCGHEHVLFLTKLQGKYTFHADAIRVPYAEATIRRWGNGQAYGGPKSEERPNDKSLRMHTAKHST